MGERRGGKESREEAGAWSVGYTGRPEPGCGGGGGVRAEGKGLSRDTFRKYNQQSGCRQQRLLPSFLPGMMGVPFMEIWTQEEKLGWGG